MEEEEEEGEKDATRIDCGTTTSPVMNKEHAVRSCMILIWLYSLVCRLTAFGWRRFKLIFGWMFVCCCVRCLLHKLLVVRWNYLVGVRTV